MITENSECTPKALKEESKYSFVIEILRKHSDGLQIFTVDPDIVDGALAMKITKSSLPL
jgi:hypothetical protein